MRALAHSPTTLTLQFDVWLCYNTLAIRAREQLPIAIFEAHAHACSHTTLKNEHKHKEKHSSSDAGESKDVRPLGA